MWGVMLNEANKSYIFGQLDPALLHLGVKTVGATAKQPLICILWMQRKYWFILLVKIWMKTMYYLQAYVF